MRKLESFFKDDALSQRDKILIIGGGSAVGSKSSCGETTCDDGCEDYTHTWERDDAEGRVISTSSQTTVSTNDCA